MAGASMSSLTEVHGDKLSLLSQDGQPLVIPYKHRVKQVMPVSLSCRCHVQAVFSRQLEACTVSASSACGACGVCLIPLLCFGKGSEQSSTTLVCITSFDNVCALIHMHLEFRLSLENKHVKTRLFEQ